MSKRVYISADYSPYDGDTDVVDVLIRWGSDKLHSVDFVDLAQVESGSVSNEPDCRICDLKREFNAQINASSVVIFVVGDKTASRTAGSACPRNQKTYWESYCTPYKQNTNGKKACKYPMTCPCTSGDIGEINSYSYLEHEFQEAVKRGKKIIIFYNASISRLNWLPSYMSGYEDKAMPFWTYDSNYNRVGNYELLKKELSNG